MKIIKLTMNAFSSYHKKTVIDFSEMIDQGIYLISGPTGSGKTTIFDAITFALYGQPSGSQRTQMHFRSDFADKKDETYVELEFELHNKYYTVKRSPSYMIPGRKNARSANAYLTYDHQTIEGVREVNQKINELLGVDVNQFKQIVMIAQGEFTKLINASSEEREKVLRHIFNTLPLLRFEEQLKEKVKQYKEQYSLSKQSLMTTFSLLSFNQEFFNNKTDFHPSYIDDALLENTKLYHQYNQSNNEYLLLKEHYNVLNEQYRIHLQTNNSIKEYQINKEKQLLLNQQQETMNEISNDISLYKIIVNNQNIIYEYHQSNNDYHRIKQLLDQENKDYVILNKDFDDISLKYHQNDTLKIKKDDLLIQINQLNDYLNKKKEYDFKKQEYHQLYESYQSLKKQNTDYIESLETLKKRIERDQENIKRLPLLSLELEAMEKEVNESNERKITIHTLSQLNDEYLSILDHHYELSKIYHQKDALYQKVFQEYLKEDENFKRGQAGILALSLEDNMPCPVCGSLHHPLKATLDDHVLTASELESLSQKVDNLKNDKELAYQDVLLSSQRQQNIQARIDIYKEQLGIDEELSKEVFIKVLSEIIQITKDQKKKYQKLNSDITYLKKLKKSVEKDLVDYQTKEQLLQQQNNQLHNQELKLHSLLSFIESFEIKDENLYSYDVLNHLQDDFKHIEDQIKDNETNYHQISQKLALLKHTIISHNDELSLLKLRLSKHKQSLDALIQQYFKDEDTYLKYYHTLNKLEKLDEQYQHYLLSKKSVEDRLEELKEYKDLSLIDLSEELKKLEEEEIKMNAVYKYTNELFLIYTKNNELIEKLKKIYKDNQKILEQYSLYLDLADYTSGKNGQRMSFERYVLSSYFEMILEYANIELLKMSQGRYALFRKKEVKGNGKQGLDLSVLDYETGMLRDVQSLSGGESFKAALSLALGLSSMIQSYAGGIELNTLFIDEGFGSLDSESIDQSLKVLLDLKNDNKVIGIISHVSELKERINTQIIVEKGKKGSYLHIEKD